MPDTPETHIPPELIEHINRGDCVLFVGDNLDGRGAQSAHLASKMTDACGDWCEFCQAERHCMRPQNCTRSLGQAAQLFEKRKKRYELVEFVRKQIEAGTLPTPLHQALADLPVRVIITTAYDDRLEVALRQQGRKYLSVVRDEDVPFDDPERVQLIRLHGTLSQTDSLVLTQDDADDLFARLPAVTKILQAHFASKTLLFIGYGLNDPHFRALYRQVTGPVARYQRPAFAVQWPPDRRSVDLWSGQVDLIEAEPLAFLSKLARQRQVVQVNAQRAALPPEPYKFLDYYTAKDVAIFFGRDLEADLLLSMVLAHPLSVFYGRSGTGKTSLLLARLLPRFEKERYHVAYARMLGDPSNEVKAALRGVGADELSYADRGRRLADVLADHLAPGRRQVIVLDQFEEFFIRQGEATRRAFAQELVACLHPEAIRKLDVRFVLSLRDDYLGALDELSPYLSQDIFTNRYRLENLTREKADLAIIKPAEAFGLPVEDALRSRLLADLEDQGLETANLQIVLYQLYQDAVTNNLWNLQSRSGTGLHLERYQALGGVKEILAGYLDRVLAELPDETQRQAARLVLKSMITAERTKLAVSGQEIARNELIRRSHLSEAELDEVLRRLRESRVVRKFGEEERYELSHEVMVEKVWGWVSEDELRLFEVRDLLRRASSDYHKFGHLMSKEKLELVQSCYDELNLETEELDLLLRSALAEQANVPYWSGSAPAVVGKIENELFAELECGDERRAGAAVERLVGLSSPELAHRLAQIVEKDFDKQSLTCYDYQGRLQKVLRSALNLRTLRQRCAIAVLRKLRLPEADKILKDWTPPGMILVPTGLFQMGGTDRSDDGPVHEVWLDAFWIDRYPVTNAQYAAFMESGAAKQRELWTESGWNQHQGQTKPERQSYEDAKFDWDQRLRMSDHPVVSVSWYQALACARWMGKRLLSEAQWEKAAGWVASRQSIGDGKKLRYPWGDEFDRNKCNTSLSGIGGTTPVGQYSPAGDSPYGCADMAGNVWEWCCNLKIPYPYRCSDGREELEGTGDRVARGGSWNDVDGSARCAYRYWFSPGYRLDYYGLRCGL